MTTILLVKGEDGKIVGFRERDKRAYARLRSTMRDMEIGEIMSIRHWFPRNGKFHRLHMKMIRLMWESQEVFSNDTQFRMWSEIGAGHCDWVPCNGVLVAVPKSIAFDEIDDEEARVVHENTKRFFRGERAQSEMWPHLSPEERAACADAVLDQFEKE